MTIKSMLLWVGATVGLLCANQAAWASPAEQVKAPPSLEQWRGWIEQGKPERDCPGRDASYCVWLGALTLEQTGSRWKGSFPVSNLMAKEVKMHLPGADGSWPSVAKVDGASTLIGRDAQGPYVMMAPKKKADISFELSLDRSASVALTIPQGFPLVRAVFASGEIRYFDSSTPIDLSMIGGGKALSEEGSIDPFNLSAENKQIPNRGPASLTAKAKEQPTVRISRLVQDAQVPILLTRIKIENGSERRLVSIENVVPEGSPVFDLRAPGARLAGRLLSVEAPPGVSILNISSFMEPSLGLKWGAMSSPDSQLDEHQYVFVQADERFRKVSAQGEAIDPKSIDPMLSFGAMPAYAVGLDGKGLGLTPKPIEKQGDDSSAAVRSEAWISFDGTQVFLTERLAFLRSAQGWFEPVGGWSSTQASSGEGAVVVAKSEAGEAGRVATATGMGTLDVGMVAPASFWLGIPAIATEGIVAKSSQALVHLPLGWRALGVFGAGQSDAGWMASLSLWDWFLLIVAVWVCKALLGWRVAGSLLVAMAFGRLFLGAPFTIYLPLLGALALARNLPSGGFKTASLALAALFMTLLLTAAAPYTMARIQKTMHASLEDGAQPGVEQSSGRSSSGTWRSEISLGDSVSTQANAISGSAMRANSLGAGPAGSVPMSRPSASDSSPMAEQESRSGPSLKAATSAPMEGARVEVRPPAAGAQAGQGIPAWRSGVGVTIVFPTPASSAAVAKILLMPPWLVKIMSLISLAALWASIGAMFRLGWTLGRHVRVDAARRKQEAEAQAEMLPATGQEIIDQDNQGAQP